MTHPSSKPPTDACIYTLCLLQHHDPSILEAQVNYLSVAPLAALHRCETTARGEEVLVTLWFEAMPGQTIWEMCTPRRCDRANHGARPPKTLSRIKSLCRLGLTTLARGCA